MFLKREHLVWTALLLALSLVGACTPDLGTPDYSSQVGLREPVDPFPPIPRDPYQPGDDRLSVGFFYEGGRSETIPINGVTTNYFIFVIDENKPVETLTYSQDASSDRIEGLESAEIRLNDRPFWGGGIIWDEPIDLSEWTTMYVGFKSSDESFERFDLTLQFAPYIPNEPPPDPRSVVLDPRTYGYTNDGEWHFLEIPLQHAIDRGFDPSITRSPFIVSGPTRQAGDVLLIDNLYFTKDESPGTGGGGGMGGAGGTGGGTPGAVYGRQDFESLDPESPTALSDDGWLYFGNVYSSTGALKFGFGPFDAPTTSGQISGIATGEGGPDQGAQQLVVFSNYECCQPDEGHFGTDLVETIVFQEIASIPADFIGQTLEFSFDAKRGNIEGAATAEAFIKTVDPDAGFATTNNVVLDTTNLPTDWATYSIILDLSDPLLEGQILQFGFQNTASNFEGSGNFYDNVLATLSADSGGGGGTGGAGGAAGTGGT